MSKRRINDALVLSWLEPKHAPSLFVLTDRNRNYLRQWLPWVDATIHEDDTAEFINEQQRLFRERKVLQAAIEYETEIVGVIGYHEFDLENDMGSIGYWLSEEFNGLGLMTMAVEEMISVGFDEYALNRIEIKCAKENRKSRAIPERLGFTNEGTLRNSEKVNGKYLDLVVYGLLRSDVKR